LVCKSINYLIRCFILTTIFLFTLKKMHQLNFFIFFIKWVQNLINCPNKLINSIKIIDIYFFL
jgi:hypothetical protein